MQRIIKYIFLFSSLLISSCGDHNENTTKTDDYDLNWTEGENALKRAMKVKIKNPQGDFSSYINKLRKSQDNAALPSKGEANILVVPIEFKDSDNDYKFIEDDIEAIKKSYFEDSLIDIGLAPSVKEYYSISSNNSLNLDGVVTPVISLEEDYITYLYKAINSSFNEVKVEILSYVYNYLFNETKTYYLKDFDSDDDNKIDNIVLLYNYPSLESDTYFSSSKTYMSSLFNSTTFLNDEISEYNKELPIN